MVFTISFSTVFVCILIANVLSAPVDKKNSKHLENSSRVVNGEPVVDKDEFPFVVDLSAHDMKISSSRFCTGTLVKPDVILTAAHCVLNEGYLTPVYATIGRIELDDKHKDNSHAETFRTIASIVHPHYRGIGSPKDVALLLLNSSSTGQLVHLAQTTPSEDDETWVVGYGIQKIGTLEESFQAVEIMSSRLQKTALRVKDRAFCDIPSANIRTPGGMLCTEGIKKGSSACKGDSGGGLFQRKKHGGAIKTLQVGIVSYGDSQCMSEDSGVFTDVASVRDWIESSAMKLQKAFHSEDINIGDEDKSAIVRKGVVMSEKGNSRFVLAGNMQHEHVKLYRIRTTFKENKKLTVSLCDGPKNSNVRLHVTNDADSRIIQDNGSCPGGKLSKLSFTARQGSYIVGVSAQEAIPFRMDVMTESI